MDLTEKQPLQKPTQVREQLIERFISIRNESINICSNLELEDFVVQPCQEVSPLKWHLGHTTWLFEELILVQFENNFPRFDENFRLLFNSYYKSVGKHWLQGSRGQLSRPTVKQVQNYRAYIDKHMIALLKSSTSNDEIDLLVEIGLHHEQQHQELLYMDIKFILGTNPSFPAYRNDIVRPVREVLVSWKDFPEGVYKIGHRGEQFSFDNEVPCHKNYIYPFSVRESTVSNGEYLAFINSSGYANPKFWLSEGWDWVNAHTVNAPLYWLQKEGEWFEFTLYGLRPLDLHAPVTHISYFEAGAYATWAGCRLPTEQELELYLNESGSIRDDKVSLYHPNQLDQAVGQVWCWTKSHYSPYPGYRPFKGMLGEYNGKFMCNQFVLKGGCVTTPKGHYRHSYRNFYSPQQRWMFSGIRLAKDVS